MASRRFLKVLDQETGPVTFQDLVEMIRAGRLTEDGLVRREIGSEWIRARDVIGLFPIARGQAAGPAPPEVEEEAESTPRPKPAATTAARVSKPPRKRQRWKAIGGLLVVLALAATCVLWATRRPRGVKPRTIKPPRTDEATLTAIRARRPTPPTIPGLPERVPQLVPGLEGIDPAFTPCLTPDLRTIVFSSIGDQGTGYDLYEATRGDSSRPFDKPRLIQACVSPATDARPTLSPDGLELIFRRTTHPPQLWRTTPESRSSEFPTPQRLALPEREIAGRTLGPPQLVDRFHLLVTATHHESQVCSILLAKRPSQSSAFGSLRRVRFYHPARVYFLAADRLRAYAGGAEGLLVASRKSEEDGFDEGTLIAPASVTGPVEDQIWVAPREDLIVYSSPGPGQKIGTSRKLWAIRF